MKPFFILPFHIFQQKVIESESYILILKLYLCGHMEISSFTLARTFLVYSSVTYQVKHSHAVMQVNVVMRSLQFPVQPICQHLSPPRLARAEPAGRHLNALRIITTARRLNSHRDAVYTHMTVEYKF